MKHDKDRWFRSGPTAPQFSAEHIDLENGILRSVVMAQAGPAKGHGFSIDQQFIADLVAFDTEHFSSTGVKARFGHPAMSDTTMGKQMGVFKNFRIEEDRAIADLHLLDSADKSPSHPNMREWMLGMAQEQPDFVMSSIVFQVGEYFQLDDNGEKVVMDEGFYPGWDKPKFEDRDVFASFKKHFYTDLVEQGAVTDHLFTQQFNRDKFAVQVIEFVQDHPDLLAFLRENPAKLTEFAEKLGIELPKPKFSFGEKLTALKDIFAPGQGGGEVDLETPPHRDRRRHPHRTGRRVRGTGRPAESRHCRDRIPARKGHCPHHQAGRGQLKTEGAGAKPAHPPQKRRPEKT